MKYVFNKELNLVTMNDFLQKDCMKDSLPDSIK